MTCLNIDIVSDVVCLWCFIGKRRLERALDLLRTERPDLAVTVRWLPFFLNPHTPPAGEPYRVFLEKKFGGAAQVEALWDRARQAGHTVGVDFAFEQITVRPNTLQAHRLIHWAQAHAAGGASADALIERLFVGHFQRGEHIGDAQVLQTIAAECGYPAAVVAEYLASTVDADLVRAAESRSRECGVSSVPTFICNGAYAVSGAETPELLAEAMRCHLPDAA